MPKARVCAPSVAPEPARPPNILAIDAGTSSVKAILASPAAGGWRVLARASHPLDAPAAPAGGAGAEQEPEQWWSAARAAIAEVRRACPDRAVDALGLSGQMQGLVLCGADGAALRPALLYSDARATAEAAQLEATLGRERLLAETANWKGAVSVLPKLLWLAAHEPAALEAAEALLLGSQ